MGKKQANLHTRTGDSWAEVSAQLGTDLFLDLPPEPHSTRGRGARKRRMLADALRDAIAEGRLAPDTALPPYRSLAADLGLARGTVAAVYAELVAEGRLVARQGSRTRVATGRLPRDDSVRPTYKTPAIAHDFSLGQPNSSMFPRSAWASATRQVMATAPDSAFAPSAPNGSERLRRELTTYLARSRGVRTSPDCIVLTTSVMSALDLLARTVFERRVAVEAHGLPFHRDAIAARGVAVTPIAVDRYGADIDSLAGIDVSAVVLTPSHQFPLGVPLAPERRTRVIDWAARTGSLIVEDDYDGEFRYDRRPVGALQGLAPESVIYTGSVSKSLSPAVRVGWLVLPAHLVPTVMWAKGIREPDASIVDQLVLAEMIAGGTYDTHIRRSRQFYRARRDLVTARLAEHGIPVAGIDAGLHAVIPMPARTEAAILEACYDRGFAVAGVEAMRHRQAAPLVDEAGEAQGGIVIGFGTPSPSTYARDVDALVEFLTDYLPHSPTYRTADSAPRNHEGREENPPAGTPANTHR